MNKKTDESAKNGKSQASQGTSSEAAETTTTALSASYEEPSAGPDKEPSADAGKEPSAGVGKEPSADAGKEPSADAGKEPSAGAGKEPSAAGNREPSAGPDKEPSAGVGKEPSAGVDKKPPAPEQKPSAPDKVANSSAKPPPEVVTVVRSGGRWLALLALLVALAAAAAAAWLYLQQEATRADLAAREAQLDRDVALISETAATAKQAIAEAIDASRQSTMEVSERLADERARLQSQFSATDDRLGSVESALRRQRQQLIDLRSTDRVDWTLAEAEYLLRLGYQRLVMAEDVESALALLESADAIMSEIDDTDLLAAREAIARDMAALRAVPEVDVEGVWLRLQALVGRVDKLILFQLPNAQDEAAVVDPDADWQQRLSLGVDAALEKIAGMLVIRRREQPYQALMDPQWEQLVRQNLRMQLAQSQAALLSGNAVLYQASLNTTRRWLREFFDFNETEVRALNTELDALSSVRIGRDIPDISESLKAVKTAVDLRHEVN